MFCRHRNVAAKFFHAARVSFSTLATLAPIFISDTSVDFCKVRICTYQPASVSTKASMRSIRALISGAVSLSSSASSTHWRSRVSVGSTSRRQCVLEAEDDKETAPEIKARIERMLAFVETLAGWYVQMRTLQKSTLVSLMKMGAKVAKVLKLTRAA